MQSCLTSPFLKYSRAVIFLEIRPYFTVWMALKVALFILVERMSMMSPIRLNDDSTIGPWKQLRQTLTILDSRIFAIVDDRTPRQSSILYPSSTFFRVPSTWYLSISRCKLFCCSLERNGLTYSPSPVIALDVSLCPLARGSIDDRVLNNLLSRGNFFSMYLAHML